jgi:hypothetical protein
VSSGEGDDILRGCNRGEAAKVRVFPTRKNCLFFLTGLKMVVGVGFCKIKVDSNFLLVLKIKCTKFHQDRSKTVDLHTKYTNKQTFSFIYSVEFTYGINSVISKLMTFAENTETGQFLFLIMLVLSYFTCSCRHPFLSYDVITNFFK